MVFVLYNLNLKVKQKIDEPNLHPIINKFLRH